MLKPLQLEVPYHRYGGSYAPDRPRGRYRTSFVQVSKFNRERIEPHCDCGISFREIAQRVGRNQATVMGICHRWMKEETTIPKGPSHPPLCTTARDDRRITHMAVMDFAASSQQIQSVTHHLQSACTIRRRLLQSGTSARRPLLRLPLTGNHKRLRRQ
ncbi:transposable element Tc1 transposase [Trichonephila clavipes]|nr:transposable element Tc1 transposase [Trichonephila clavipes]